MECRMGVYLCNMHQMEVVYEGGLRTIARHLRSGVEVITDAPVDNQGKGASFSPTDLASCSLASCMLTIIGILAQNHGFSIDGTKAEVTKLMAAEPRRIASIKIRLLFPGQISYSLKEKAMIKRAAQTCPVALSLNESLDQELSFVFEGSEEA